jgi:hypothetical protein
MYKNYKRYKKTELKSELNLKGIKIKQEMPKWTLDCRRK